MAPSLSRRRVLIVDDEDALRDALARLLRRNYDVVGVASGLEAQTLLAEDAAFDGILCDLMMPRMGGEQFHRMLVRDYPDLADKVVFMSGGPPDRRTRRYLETLNNPRLMKPFGAATLRAALEQLEGPAKNHGA